MHDDATYNLMSQYTHEHRSLWRIKKYYLKDAKGHPEDLAFWKHLAEEKEAHLALLRNLLADRVQEDKPLSKKAK